MLPGKDLLSSTMNVQKFYSYFLCIPKFCSSCFCLYNQELEKSDYFTYLGMLFAKHMNLHHAASHALNPLKAAIRSVMLKLAP
jgi:hypothetical protein